MPTFEVVCTGTVRKVYQVEAATEADALRYWPDGELVRTEASAFPDSARLLTD